MDINLIVGLATIIISLAFTTYLTFYSRKSIDKIAKKNLTNVRQIMRELRNGR